MGDGLIYAFLLDGQGGGTVLDWEQAQQWRPEQGILWLHLNFENEQVRHWLCEDSGLDDLVVDALMAEEPRPRVAAMRNGLLMALRGVNMNPGANPEDMVSIRLWVTEQRIISTRRRRLLSIDDLVADIKNGCGPTSSASFVAQLCECLIQRMADVIEQAEDTVDDLEEGVLESERKVLRADLASLRRQTISLRRYISPQREALNRLQVETIPWFEERSRLHVRELADRLVVYVDALDSVRERAAVTQEELVNQVSEEANQRMYVLSIVAAIFLPLGFFTGLLGINVGGMPGADNPFAFWLVVTACILMTTGAVVLFKRKRWL